MDFKLSSDYAPSGDQPEAIRALTDSLRADHRYQTLLGVTGSGKTFSMANVIQELQRPTLVISHNKTLAAQLYSEFKAFFPDNAVEYFVSYYDYYQPEAYIPQTDTYIEKDSSINEEIERLRISASSPLLSREDVMIVASCFLHLRPGLPGGLQRDDDQPEPGLEISSATAFLEKLVDEQYTRNDIDPKTASSACGATYPGNLSPPTWRAAIRIEFFGDEIESIRGLDPVTGEAWCAPQMFHLYPRQAIRDAARTRSKCGGGIRGSWRSGWPNLNRRKS